MQRVTEASRTQLMRFHQDLQAELLEHRAPVIETARLGDFALRNFEDVDAIQMNPLPGRRHATLDGAVIGSGERPLDMRNRRGWRDARHAEMKIRELRRQGRDDGFQIEGLRGKR